MSGVRCGNNAAPTMVSAMATLCGVFRGEGDETMTTAVTTLKTSMQNLESVVQKIAELLN